jgi:hypothetical protein
MERVISIKIADHWKHNNILNSAQYGFVKGRSTCTNLVDSMNDWTNAMQSDEQTTVIYIDFTKPFDTVSHTKLFAKLSSYGIQGKLLAWLRCFYSNRSHQTKVGQSLSSILDLIFGIVQGSGIGPIMFVCFINELIDILKNTELKCVCLLMT